MHEPLHAAMLRIVEQMPIHGFLGLGCLQVIEAPAGVRVQGEETGLLALERVEAILQTDMLGDVGEIPGVVDVLVVHGRGCPAPRP